MLVYRNFPPQTGADITLTALAHQDYFGLGPSEEGMLALGSMVGSSLVRNVVHEDKIGFTNYLALDMLEDGYDDLAPHLVEAYKEGVIDGIAKEGLASFEESQGF